MILCRGLAYKSKRNESWITSMYKFWNYLIHMVTVPAWESRGLRRVCQLQYPLSVGKTQALPGPHPGHDTYPQVVWEVGYVQPGCLPLWLRAGTLADRGQLGPASLAASQQCDFEQVTRPLQASFFSLCKENNITHCTGLQWRVTERLLCLAGCLAGNEGSINDSWYY